MGDRSAKARLQEVRVTESKFADYVAVYMYMYATTREAFTISADVTSEVSKILHRGNFSRS